MGPLQTSTGFEEGILFSCRETVELSSLCCSDLSSYCLNQCLSAANPDGCKVVANHLFRLKVVSIPSQLFSEKRIFFLALYDLQCQLFLHEKNYFSAEDSFQGKVRKEQ